MGTQTANSPPDCSIFCVTKPLFPFLLANTWILIAFDLLLCCVKASEVEKHQPTKSSDLLLAPIAELTILLPAFTFNDLQYLTL